jgi:hypothetical protein
MSTARRQMDPARRAAGKKPDAAALGNARIVPRLFTSALGGGLSAWAHVIRGDSEARLQGFLLGTRQILFAVASAKSRDPKSDLRVSRRTTTPGNNLEGINTTVPQVAAALLSKVPAELTSQQAPIVDTLKRQCPGFAVMRKLAFGLRAILRGGKVTTLHRWMEDARKTGITGQPIL